MFKAMVALHGCFRLQLTLCGHNEYLRVYQAQLLDPIFRCNDMSGSLSSVQDGDNSATNMKMARAMDMCGQYPLFTRGPSSQWFSVSIRKGTIVGVDFPGIARLATSLNQEDRHYIGADQAFKRHAIQDVLFATPAQVCMPASDTTQCTHIDRNETLLLTTRKTDTHNAPGTLADTNQMTEAVNRLTLSTYEINNVGELNRANSFGTVTFETTPLALDSNVGVVIRRGELKTRWEMFKVEAAAAAAAEVGTAAAKRGSLLSGGNIRGRNVVGSSGSGSRGNDCL